MSNMKEVMVKDIGIMKCCKFHIYNNELYS